MRIQEGAFEGGEDQLPGSEQDALECNSKG